MGTLQKMRLILPDSCYPVMSWCKEIHCLILIPYSQMETEALMMMKWKPYRKIIQHEAFLILLFSFKEWKSMDSDNFKRPMQFLIKCTEFLQVCFNT